MPHLPALLGLCGAAFLAGWVDAVSGGGGLVQLPALLVLLPGAAPATVLATNKLAAASGTAVAAWTYLRRVRPDLRTALPMAGAALTASAGGAFCATLVPARVFRPVVLVVVVLVGAYTLLRPRAGELQQLRWSGSRHLLTALAVAVVIGFYDGAIGPGTGSFLVFALVTLLGYSFLQASAKARIVNLATNAGALVVFVAHGAPDYPLGALMAVSNIAGGRLGAVTAISRGTRFVRVVFLAVVVLLVASLVRQL
ncbi:hypothetical protein EV189_2378 [Motilibacter rhizosphaerae]|uniref:Probable membrane transporter protein n=1 Tax=Motilibacter rhizosphaerae TaxID=598652 RepID=A0A4Q7NNY9_9ACTN|nr:TSUP family transporter [Motilibacter rhizosphaerae]RZS86959.1 hypothetical protein EV189_2378 [Motilibacter rhizosphaerae]